MMLTDSLVGVFVSKVLHLGPGKRKEFLKQVDHLIGRLKEKIAEDASFKVKGFTKTGSLMKGIVLKPKGDYGVDADIAVFLDVSESEKDDVARLHEIILKLVIAVYPTKKKEDFQVQPRTFVAPRSQIAGGYARSSRLVIRPFPRKQDLTEF